MVTQTLVVISEPKMVRALYSGIEKSLSKQINKNSHMNWKYFYSILPLSQIQMMEMHKSDCTEIVYIRAIKVPQTIIETNWF